jgi:RimJ/RimL family protein N-acetyltransferase
MRRGPIKLTIPRTRAGSEHLTRMSYTAPNPIESERLLLRLVAESDLPALLEVNGDDTVTRFLPYATWNSGEACDVEAYGLLCHERRNSK